MVREIGRIYELNDQEYKLLSDKLRESRLRFEMLDSGAVYTGVEFISYSTNIVADGPRYGYRVGVKVLRKGISGNTTICSWDSMLTSLLEELVNVKCAPPRS